MEKELWFGKMGENIKANFLMIRGKDMACINGAMDENMKDNGKMINNMEREFT